MAYSGKYNGCKVFIYTEGKEKLSIDTTIVEYNSVKLNIFVNGSLPELKDNDKVSLVLLLDTTIIEYQGVIRRADTSGNREITLFKGHEKEDREERRYELNITSIIEGLLVGSNIVVINPGAVAVIVNISKSGILVRMKAGILNKGTSFRIRMDVSGVGTVLDAKVMRLRLLSENEVEYGCVLLGKG